MLFGPVSFVLPVIMIVFALYLARHPSTTRDNSRIGIGLFLLLITSSGFFHLFSAQPQPTDGVVALSDAGGLLGWLIAIPFLSTISIWGAVPVLVLFGLGSILIMTRTAPNKIGERLGELYEYLFGSALERKSQDDSELEVHDAFDGTKAPWWRRSKKDDNAYLADQAKEALNFQITMLLAQFVAGVLVVILVGFLLLGIVWLVNVVFCIVAAINWDAHSIGSAWTSLSHPCLSQNAGRDSHLLL
jgi:hypothetical protein